MSLVTHLMNKHGHARKRPNAFAHSLIRAKRIKMSDTEMTEAKKRKTEGYKGEMIPGIDGKTQFGFPSRLITILRYVESVDLTSTTGSVAFNAFSMNNTFDPNATGTGHQPMYRDNYAALYDRYRVLGARAIVRFCPKTLPVATSGPVYIGINGSNIATTVSGTAEARAEQNDSVFDVIGLNGGGRDAVKTLFYTYDPESKLGLPAGDDTTSSGVGSGPSSPYYIQPWIADQTGTSTFAIIVEIHYTVEFFSLQEQTIN